MADKQEHNTTNTGQLNSVDPDLVNVAPLAERILLMKDTNRTFYAVGWSRGDILVDVEDQSGNPLASDILLRTMIVRNLSILEKIPQHILEELWRNRPAASDAPVMEDELYGGRKTKEQESQES